MVGPTPPAPGDPTAGKPAAPVPPPPPAAPTTITIDDFKKVVLKVGKVVEASAHTNANKLLVLKVDIGGEIRQVVSGIKQWYTPEQLVGKSVILVANLAPAMLRGVESQGMVLAASSGDQVILLSPEKDASPGSKVS
jgi:methionyl-tRNA synthetase